jgi:hypothetical protein
MARFAENWANDPRAQSNPEIIQANHFDSARIRILHEKRTLRYPGILTAFLRESSFRSHLLSLKTEEEDAA